MARDESVEVVIPRREALWLRELLTSLADHPETQGRANRASRLTLRRLIFYIDRAKTIEPEEADGRPGEGPGAPTG